jgi:Zn-dependent metalloprotease
VRLLKGAVCLVMLGAGIAAVPSQLAGAAAPAAAADDSSLVRDMRNGAEGTVVTSAEESTGKVGFIRVKGASADLLPEVAAKDAAGAAAKADAYLAKYSAAFGASKEQLKREEVVPDAQGWTVNYTQTYKGLPVFGSLLRAHVDKQGDLTAVNGYAAPDLSLSTDALKSPSAGADRAIAFVRSAPGEGFTGAEARALKLTAASNKLMVYRQGSTKGVQGPATLAYVVDVTDGASVREKVFVDANSGKILNRYSMIDNALDRELYEAFIDDNGTPEDEDDDFVGFDLVWAEGDDLDEDCTGDACDDELNGDQRNLVLSTGESYWLFKNAFGRDSYDGGGATMKTVNNDPRINCPNANWNGQTTNYCDGVTSDDVVSHEWGHAYTEYTHGLIYQWQSGALNESYSDIWGETLDLINNREDEGEGDITAKRSGNLCATEGPRAVQLVINNPADIRKVCLAGPAAWGAVPDTNGITDDIVLGLDADEDGDPSPDPNVFTGIDGCSPLTNAAEVNGNFGLVQRGGCAFTLKAQNLVAAGATGVIIFNNNNGGPFGPGGGLPEPLDVPVIGISQADGERIANKLPASPVNGTIRLSGTAESSDSFRWLMGEKSTAFGGAIRDMWAPTCAGDPGKVSDIEYVCSTDDQGGVHSNSGVPNHGYALLVDGGTFNGVTVSGIGLTKAAHIYYRAMTTYQTPVSGFADHADALAASCADLTNVALKELSTDPNTSITSFKKITAADCAQVDAMAQAVELRLEPVQCDFQPLLDPNDPAACGPGTGESVSFEDDFEGGIGDWELDGFNPFGGPTRDWESASDLPDGNKPAGSTQAAFGPTPDLGTCTGDAADFSSVNTMTSPEIEVGQAGDASPRLVFDHNVQTELGFDGGTVSIAVNGGPFATIPAEAYVFNEPTVLATEAAGNTNPLAGEDGFTGTDGGKIVSDWGTSIIDLEAAGAAVGDTVQVRFSIGRDGCGGVVGWYVDNVRVITCVDLATATVAAAHVPNPSTYGQNHSVDVTVSGSEGTPTGAVTVMNGDTTLGTANLDGSGAASIALDKLLPARTYNLTVEYSGDSAYDVASTSVAAKVAKATPTITAKAKPDEVKKGSPFKAKVRVTGDGFVPTGKVIITWKGNKIGQGTLVDGKVRIKLDADFPVGKVTLKAKYLGSANVNRAKVTFELTVLKK